jgi:hypothetical protein
VYAGEEEGGRKVEERWTKGGRKVEERWTKGGKRVDERSVARAPAVLSQTIKRRVLRPGRDRRAANGSTSAPSRRIATSLPVVFRAGLRPP